MMDATISPAYVIRSYVWEVLKRNDPGVWDESKYGGLTPIVPLAEEPELDEYTGPRIVYGYATSRINDLPARRTASMTFVVYDQNFRRLTKTLNILYAALDRDDETARDINRFSSEYVVNGHFPYRGVSFGYVRMGYTEGGTPEDTEGGRQSALINITFEYYVDYNVITDVSS